MNRLRVLDAVREHGAMTQVEIAGVTGLSAATVSNLVKELDGAGAVRLTPSIRNGRRAVQVSVEGGQGLVGAAVFGDRDVRVAVGEAGTTDLVSQKRMPLPADHAADEGMARAARMVQEMVEASGHALGDLAAMVVGLPAPIDGVSGEVGSTGILPGWRGVPVASAMEVAYGMTVRLENTANLAALGEARYGALQGISTGVYLKMSYGVGAGLVIGGELFRGSAGTAGEIGHVTIDENGPVCRCGNRGCLDTYVGRAGGARGPPAVARDAEPARRHRPGAHRGTSAAAASSRTPGGTWASRSPASSTSSTPRSWCSAARSSRVGEIVLRPMREAVERCAIPSAAASLDLRLGTLGPEEADVRGALALAEQARVEADRAALIGQ